MSVSIDDRGAKEKLSVVRFQRATERGLEGSARFYQRTIATYPPAPANSSYRRTGRLGRSWIAEPESGMSWLVSSRGVTYNEDVQGATTQLALFRRIGWFNTWTAEVKAMPRMLTIMRAEYVREYAKDRR